MKNKKRILVCPLDWGLGHAARMVPVVRELMHSGFDVVIGADKGPLELLCKEFPSLESIKLPGVVVKYSKRKSQVVSMLLQMPKLMIGFRKENRLLSDIVRTYRIDVVISDNRYGLYSKEAHTVLVTHQLMIKMPHALRFLEKLVHNLVLRKVKKFDQCWIPDYPGEENLSGDLSHKYPLPATACFVGSLSRFKKEESKATKEWTYDIIAVLSGPEPQRSILEEMLEKQLSDGFYRALIVRGKVGFEEKRSNNGIVYKNFATGRELVELFSCSETIICRAGYSTIMDLISMQRKAILIPTPGQTEQIYLAKHFSAKGSFYTISQESLILGSAIAELKKISGIFAFQETDLLKNYIDKINELGS